MGKTLKILFSLFGTLVLLLIVAAIVIPLLVDPNDYKDEIITLVDKQTGRKLEIEGDIGLSVFPWLGLDIGTTRLGNAAGFSEPYMASVEAVQLRVKLLPLLRKQLQIDTVKLDGMQVNLGKDSAGSTNWADLVSPAPETGAAEQETGAAEGAALEGFAIGGVDIRNARLVWDDRQAGQRYEVHDLSLSTGEIQPGAPFDLELGFTVQSSEPAMTSTLQLSGTLQLNEAMRAVAISGARLQLDARGAAIPAGEQRLALSVPQLALDLDAQTLKLPELELEAAGVKVSGQLEGSGVGGDKPAIRGNLQLAAFAPRSLLEKLGQPVPATTDDTVLGKAAASLQLDASSAHAALSGLDLTLDDTKVTGQLRVDNFAAPAIAFTLAVDSIDLDRYLPPPAPEGAAPAETAQGKSEAPQLDGLRKLNLNGTITVAKMKASGLSYSDAVLTVKAQNGVVHLHPIGAKLYGGSYNGDITLDVRNSTPRISVNEKVSEVQAGPLLKDLIGDDKLLGTANLTAKFTGSGLTPEELRRTVSGNTSFSFTDGAVRGVNIAALIRKAQAAYKGQPAPPEDLPNQTDFAMLSGTAVVNKGLLTNDDLSLQSPLLRITGKGQTHLAEETIDYTLTTKLVGTLEGQGGKTLEELKGVAIPVRVSGTWSKPAYQPDLAAALGEVAKKEVQKKVDEQVEKQKEKLQEKLGDEIGDKLLKGLFK